MQIIKSALKDKYQPLTESGFRRHDDGAVLRTLPVAPISCHDNDWDMRKTKNLIGRKPDPVEDTSAGKQIF